MRRRERSFLVLVAFVIGMIAFSEVHAGFLGMGKNRSKREMIENVESKAEWVNYDRIPSFITFWNRMARIQLNTGGEHAPMIFFVLSFREGGIPGVAYRRGGTVVVRLDYKPMAMDRKIMLQSFEDARVEKKQGDLILTFKKAEGRGLIVPREDQKLLSIPALSRLLTQEATPFDEFVEIK